MKELTPKQTILILSLMLNVILLCVFLPPLLTDPTSIYKPNPELTQRIAQEHSEEAVRATEVFLDTILKTEGAFFGDLGCGEALYEALQRNNRQYRIIVTANAHDTPYPFRDVPDVWLNVTFADATTASFWYYAGALNGCEFRRKLVEE